MSGYRSRLSAARDLRPRKCAFPSPFSLRTQGQSPKTAPSSTKDPNFSPESQSRCLLRDPIARHTSSFIAWCPPGHTLPPIAPAQPKPPGTPPVIGPRRVPRPTFARPSFPPARIPLPRNEPVMRIPGAPNPPRRRGTCYLTDTMMKGQDDHQANGARPSARFLIWENDPMLGVTCSRPSGIKTTLPVSHHRISCHSQPVNLFSDQIHSLSQYSLSRTALPQPSTPLNALKRL